MRKHALSAFVLPFVLMLLTTNVSQAVAGNWAPNNAVAVGSSTSITVAAEKAPGITIEGECKSVGFEGTLGVNSNVWAFTGLAFNRCPSFVPAGIWKAKDENNEQAALEIPAGGSLKVEMLANCVLVFEPQSITQAKNYFNGENGRINPSRWIFNTPIKYNAQVPAKCFKAVEAGVGRIVGTFNMVNATNAAEAIKVN
jgi:hypothetical protein